MTKPYLKPTAHDNPPKQKAFLKYSWTLPRVFSALCTLPKSLALPAPQAHAPLTAAWGPLVAATASLRAPTAPSTLRTQLQHQAARAAFRNALQWPARHQHGVKLGAGEMIDSRQLQRSSRVRSPQPLGQLRDKILFSFHSCLHPQNHLHKSRRGAWILLCPQSENSPWDFLVKSPKAHTSLPT